MNVKRNTEKNASFITVKWVEEVVLIGLMCELDELILFKELVI